MKYFKEIIATIQDAGLRIIYLKHIQLTQKMIEMLYPEHISKEYFPLLCEYMTRGQCVAFIVAGDNAISRLRNIIGFTDPRLAKEGTIRKRFGTDKMHNAIHAPQDEGEFKRELRVLFPEIAQLIIEGTI